ncbi:MAG: alpha/beta fold hydrolase [Pirellulaceae bacterium]
MSAKTNLGPNKRTWLIPRLFVLFISLMAYPAMGQDVEKQIWYGILNVKVGELRFSIHLSQQEEESWSGYLISHDQNDAKIEIDSAMISEEEMKLSFKKVGAKFNGKFSEQKSVVKGTWSQGGPTYPIELRKVAKVPARVLAEAWKGTLKAGAREFPFQLRIFQDEGRDARVALLDSFSEGAMGLGVKLQEKDAKVEFAVPISAGKFEGVRSADGKKITGTWIQSGQRLPLEFDSVPNDQVATSFGNRPQTPKAPFAFDTKELSIPTVEGVTISGTLALPKGTGPFPVVITVSGSGPQDRDETILDHKPFLVLTEALTKRGIAVFRYDERGVGKSTGNYATSNTKDFAEDASRLLNYLAKQKEVDPKRMGIIGHSEGGIVAPMVAVKRGDLAAIVLMAGPAVTGKQIVLNQTREIAKVSGLPTASIEAQQKLMLKVLGQNSPPAVPTDKDSPKKPESSSDFFGGLMEKLAEKLTDSATEKAMLEQFKTPWMAFFLDHDPADSLTKLKTPVLALFGEKDLQVSAELNIPPMKAALEQAKNADFEIVIMKGVNHLFQTCKTGLPAEYAGISETLAPEVISKICDWLALRLSAKAP